MCVLSPWRRVVLTGGINSDEESGTGKEPWLLNTIDNPARSNPATFVLKHAPFDMIPLDAFKADKSLYNRYISLKANSDGF